MFRGVFGASKETLERDGSSPLREWYRLVFHLAAVYDIHGERVFSGNLLEGTGIIDIVIIVTNAMSCSCALCYGKLQTPL